MSSKVRRQSATRAVWATVVLSFLTVTPAHALFGFGKLLFWKTAKKTEHSHVALPGHQSRTFILSKVKASDVISPLQKYLDGVKSAGFVTLTGSEDRISVTDFTDNLLKIEVLIQEMDQTYDNPNAMARQMLVHQNLLKGVRRLGGNGLAAMGTASATSPMSPVRGVPVDSKENAAMVMGSSKATPYIPENLPAEAERIPLRDLRVTGWFKDANGIVVVLQGTTDRFYYYHGKLWQHSLYNTEYIHGISGRVVQKDLVLYKGRNDSVRLALDTFSRKAEFYGKITP